jgi:hypothetical protein
VKRSSSVRLVLLGGISTSAIVAAAAAENRITPESYYTNDYFIVGAGYYHAPFHGFFAERYNHYDAVRKIYYYGGRWSATPHRSIINISAPTAELARLAQTRRTDLPRNHYVSSGGFGSTGRSHFSGS